MFMSSKGKYLKNVKFVFCTKAINFKVKFFLGIEWLRVSSLVDSTPPNLILAQSMKSQSSLNIFEGFYETNSRFQSSSLSGVHTSKTTSTI